MAKFKVSISYLFDGVIEVEAKDEQQAREFALKDCGFTAGGSFHSSLPDEVLLDWTFPTIADKSITKIRPV